MINQIKDICETNSISGIYLVGFASITDGYGEFISDKKYLYFEFGDYVIKISKLDHINQLSKLRVIIVESVKYDCDFEDVVPCKSRIDEVIFKNPLVDNKVAKISCFNFEKNDSEFLCDALHIKLCNGQDIFLDPGFLGINIGGLDVKQVWEENQLDGYAPKEFCIEFNNK